MRAERFLDVGGQLLEGPCWDRAQGRLLFVDIAARELLSLVWRTGRLTSSATTETPSAWIPRTGGGTAVACRPGLLLVGEPPGRIDIEADRPRNRANDAKCDPHGRLWFGTMHDEAAEGEAALYRIDPGGSVTVVLPSVTISNGLGWSPDGSRMYYVDSPTRRVDVFDYQVATGQATRRRPLTRLDDLAGMPDGLAVDAEGCLWVALHDGGSVLRLAPDGERVALVELPTPRPTSCAFAGDGLETLVITTAAGPGGGGHLFAVAPEVTGLPVAAFAG